MAELIDLGKIRFYFRGSFSSGTTYERNDVVKYNGSSYVYKNATSSAGNTPTNTTYWSKLADGVYTTAGDTGKLLTNDGSTTSWTTTPSVDSITAATSVTSDELLFVGPNAEEFRGTQDGNQGGTGAHLTNAVAAFTINADDYSQIAFQNQGTSVNSSTDFIAYAAEGTDVSGYIDMGITSANFSDPEFTITGPHDGYIFCEAPDGSTGAGNLVLATGARGVENKIIFAAGGLDSDDSQMTISPNNNVSISIATQSTSATTGALTVAGGLGVSGDVHIAGKIFLGENGTTVQTNNLSVVSPQIYLSRDNLSDTVDSGIFGEWSTSISSIAKSITNKALSSNVATITTSVAHTYLVGDVVVITGVDATFNGTFVIRTIPTTTTFTYDKVAANVSSVASSGTSSVSLRRKYGSIFRDASSTASGVSLWRFYDGIGPASISGGVVDLTGGSYAAVQMGALTATTGTFSSTGSFTGLLTASGGISVTGSSKFDEIAETANILASAQTTLSVPLLTAKPIQYITANATANITISLDTTSVTIATGDVYTYTILVTNGATPYYISSIVTSPATTVTTRWQHGLAPTSGNASSVDAYTISAVKTAAGWTVFASQTKW